MPGIIRQNGLRHSASHEVSALKNLTYHRGSYAPNGENAINFELLSIATKIAWFPLLVRNGGPIKANTRSMGQGVGVTVCNPILVFCAGIAHWQFTLTNIMEGIIPQFWPIEIRSNLSGFKSAQIPGRSVEVFQHWVQKGRSNVPSCFGLFGLITQKIIVLLNLGCSRIPFATAST